MRMTERTLVLLRHAKADRPAGVADDAASADRARPRRRGRGRRLAGPQSAPARPRDLLAVEAHPADLARHRRRAGRRRRAGGPLRAQTCTTAAPTTCSRWYGRSATTSARPLLIGHNPSVSMLSALLDPDAQADSDGLRTSGLAVHRAAGWADFDRASARSRVHARCSTARARDRCTASGLGWRRRWLPGGSGSTTAWLCAMRVSSSTDTSRGCGLAASPAAPAVPEPDGQHQHRHAGQHQHPAGDLEVDVLRLDLDRERQDGAQRDEEDPATYAHLSLLVPIFQVTVRRVGVTAAPANLLAERA